MQMSSQGLSKVLNQIYQLVSIIIGGRARPAVFMKAVEPWRESPVLLDVGLHEALDPGYRLDGWEEDGLFGVMMVVHGFAPALTVCQEVANGNQIVGRDMRCLE